VWKQNRGQTFYVSQIDENRFVEMKDIAAETKIDAAVHDKASAMIHM
jgi:hypothetical protein